MSLGPEFYCTGSKQKRCKVHGYYTGPRGPAQRRRSPVAYPSPAAALSDALCAFKLAVSAQAAATMGCPTLEVLLLSLVCQAVVQAAAAGAAIVEVGKGSALAKALHNAATNEPVLIRVVADVITTNSDWPEALPVLLKANVTIVGFVPGKPDAYPVLDLNW